VQYGRGPLDGNCWSCARRSCLVGIGAGKSTAAQMTFETLGKAHADSVAVGVDDVVEFIPAYREAIESGDPARKNESYLRYRVLAKKIIPEIVAAAVSRQLDLCAAPSAAPASTSTRPHAAAVVHVRCPGLPSRSSSSSSSFSCSVAARSGTSSGLTRATSRRLRRRARSRGARVS
jgi:hypothetical protein